MKRNQRLICVLALAVVALTLTSFVMFWPDTPPAASKEVAPDTKQLPQTPRIGIAERVPDPQSAAIVEARTRSIQARGLEDLYDLAERDFPAALAEAKRQYSGRDWKEVHARLASALLEKDFSRAPEILAQLDGMALQSALMKVIPDAFRRDRAGTATIVLDKLTGQIRDLAARNLARAQLDDGTVLAAMQTHLRMQSSRQSEATASEIAAKITTVNLGAGLDWFAQISSVDDRKSAHNRIADNLRQAGDADGLVRLLAATPPEEPPKPGGYVPWHRDHLISAIALLRQKNGDQAGLEQLRGMLADDEKDFVEVGLLYADPNQPLEERYARATTLKGWARSTAVNAVITKGVSDDPENAARFVQGLNDVRYPAAVMSLIQAWKRKDAAGIEKWVRGLPPGQRREQTIEMAVGIYKYGRGTDKELAREFAALAADAGQREKLTQSVTSIMSNAERAAGAR